MVQLIGLEDGGVVSGCGLLNILSFQSRIKCGRYGVISIEL